MVTAMYQISAVHHIKMGVMLFDVSQGYHKQLVTTASLWPVTMVSDVKSSHACKL